MPPSRLFIIRHGERMDQTDPDYRPYAPRPHDSPLTAKGHLMARALGRYLREQRGLNIAGASHKPQDAAAATNVNDIVILTSPLQRCTETAHGVVEGLLDTKIGPLVKSHALTGASNVAQATVQQATPLFEPPPEQPDGNATDAGPKPLVEVQSQLLALTTDDVKAKLAAEGKPFIPLYFEPGVMEGGYWLNSDLRNAKKRGNDLSGLFAHVLQGAQAIEPQPWYLTPYREHSYPGVLHERLPATLHPVHQRTVVSPLVSAEPFLKLFGNKNEGADYFGPVVHAWDSHRGQIHEFETAAARDAARRTGPDEKHKEEFSEASASPEHGHRVVKSTKAALASPLLDGKIVLIVAHSDTTVQMRNAIAKGHSRAPEYTGWTEMVLPPPPHQHFHHNGEQFWEEPEGVIAFETPHYEYLDELTQELRLLMS